MHAFLIMLLLSRAAWQAPLDLLSGRPQEGLIELISAALALTGLFAAVYHLGILREQSTNTSRQVAKELERFRDEMTRGFGALDRRMHAFEEFTSAATEQRATAERWQGGIDITLTTHGNRLDTLERARPEVVP